MALVTLQTIFHDALPAYEQAHPLPAHVRKAARHHAVLDRGAWGPYPRLSRGAERSGLGPGVSASVVSPRRVPADGALARSPTGTAPGLRPCPRYVHPPPCPPGPVARQRARHGPLRLQTARATRATLLGDPQSLGAPPGSLAALHPWSQTLGLPPHLHGLVTGGGRTPAGLWGAVRNGLLWPLRVAMAVLRGKRVDALRQTFARGALALPEPLRPQPVVNRLHRLGHPTQTTWNVRIMARYRHGAGVVTSVARSLRGGPITSARLGAWDGVRVTCTYRAHAAHAASGAVPRQRLTWPIAAFLQRLLLYVPTPRTRVVRGDRRYQSTHAEALASCRAARGHPPVVVPARLDWQTVCAERGEGHPERGALCGQLLVCTEVIPRGVCRPAGGLRSAPQAHRPAGDRQSGSWCARGHRHGRWGRSPETAWDASGRGSTRGLPGVRAFGGATGGLMCGRPHVNSRARIGAHRVRPPRWAGSPTRR
jgi:hypothetical protein